MKRIQLSETELTRLIHRVINEAELSEKAGTHNCNPCLRWNGGTPEYRPGVVKCLEWAQCADKKGAVDPPDDDVDDDWIILDDWTGRMWVNQTTGEKVPVSKGRVNEAETTDCKCCKAGVRPANGYLSVKYGQEFAEAVAIINGWQH